MTGMPEPLRPDGLHYVRVLLNTDPTSLRGYDPGHQLVEVAAYLAKSDGMKVLDDAFQIFNVGDNPSFGTPDPRAVAYRLRGNRSLSVGDVVAVDDRFFTCSHLGWRMLDAPPAIIDRGVRAVTPFRPTPVPRLLQHHPSDHAGCRVVGMHTGGWCATLAGNLVTSDPLAAVYQPAMPIDRIAAVVGEDGATADESGALILLPFTAPEEVHGLLVIDGWTQLLRAIASKWTELPAWVLTEESANTCTVRGTNR